MTIQERNIEFSKLKSEIIRKATLKECFLKDTQEPCSNNIVNAHSLQRMGSLSILEREINGNQKIFALTEKQINPDTGKNELIPIGKKTASTFFGFCGNHDSKIFEPIEQNPELIDLDSDEHCFLLSFRAFAISYHRKKENIHLLSTTDEELKKKLRKYFNHNNLDAQLEGDKLGLEDMNPNKEILINALYKKDYSCLDFFIYELNYTVPFAMCMLTSPPYLFNGKAINISTDPDYQYSDIFTSVIPLKSRSLVVLASMKNDPFGSTYLDELERMYELPLQKALTWHVLTNAENCFFSPEWFDKLSASQKQYIVDLSEFSGSLTTPYLKYNPKDFKLNLFDLKHDLLNE